MLNPARIANRGLVQFSRRNIMVCLKNFPIF